MDKQLTYTPSWLNSGRVPSLDGLRALSIILVLWNHAVSHSTGLPLWAHRFKDTGALGVDFFFVISGFLITLLLVREQEKNGKISFAGFYKRRIYRIFPAYVVFVGIVGTALAFTSSALTRIEWLQVATYSGAIFTIKNWYMGHTWSLSVEEHFYLLWPVLFAFSTRRRLLIGCILYSVLAVALRMALYKVRGVDNWYFTPTRGDAIATGCAFALMVTAGYPWLQVQTPAACCLAAGSLVALIASQVAFAYSSTRWAVFYVNFAYNFVSEWCIVIIVWYAIYHYNSYLGRFLNWRPLIALGVMSYSIYLWQQPFLGPIQSSWMFKLPGNLLITAIMASASYFLVEQPFLRVKSRFEPTSESKRRSDAEANQLVATVS